MGIVEDFESLKSKWSSLSLLTKVIFSLLLVLSFLSIASLADHVFKLRGFIVEGLNFWSAFTAYFVDLLAVVNISIQPWQIDFWVVLGIAFFPYISERWNVLTTSRKFSLILLLVAYITFPFTVKQSFATYVAFYLYCSILVVCFLPPRTVSFKLIAVRMVTPPTLVAILAAVSEGLYRPLG